MRSGQGFPGNQAEIVFSDIFVEYLEGLPARDREAVLAEIVGLCEHPVVAHPVGTHPLRNRSGSGSLAGWNTLSVLGGEHRVVFAGRIVDGVGTIEVLCAGPRRAGAAYDLATQLVDSGRLTDDEVTEIWVALTLVDVLAEDLGLDGWDYRPPCAPEGMIRAAVASGLLEDALARVLSKTEIEAAMTGGWSPTGPDPQAALRAALREARAGVDVADLDRIIAGRKTDRCRAALPRTGKPCVRKAGHPGPHRSTT